jgi:hypothetical protein
MALSQMGMGHFPPALKILSITHKSVNALSSFVPWMQTVMVPGLGALWQAAQQLAGRRLDPLTGSASAPGALWLMPFPLYVATYWHDLLGE